MSDLSTYVKKAKEGKSELSEVMERRKSKKLQELEEAEIDAYIAEAKEKIKKASPEKLDSRETTNFAAMLFAGRKPEEIKEILSTLTQEEIDRLAYIASSMTPNGLTNFRGFLREPTTTMKDAIDAIKVGVELSRKPAETGNAVDLKGIAEIFKAGVEAAKVQNPTQPPQDPMAVYRMVQEIVKPFQEALTKEKSDNVELRMKEIESRIVNPMEQIKYIKAMSGELGLSVAGKSEYDLKLADMAQTKDLETRKLDWEMRKWELQQEGDQKKYELIGKIFEGPVGKVLESVGKAGADRVRGTAKNTSQPAPTTQTTCPNPQCQKTIYVDPNADQVTCPYCNKVLQKAIPATQSSQPPTEQPAPQETAPEETAQAPAEAETVARKPENF